MIGSRHAPERVDAVGTVRLDKRGPEAAPWAVDAVGVGKTFRTTSRSVEALQSMDLRMREGEFVCIVGPSGCGKSTFLRIVAGLLPQTSGTLRLRTRSDAIVPIATVFQDYGIFPWKTVLSNVMFGLRVNGVARRESRERARHWLGRTGLSDFADSYPATLSGGMRQRVGIARALAVEPAVLLMDEPFAALDAQLREILQEELLAICEADRRTVIFVTHSLEEALVLGDRVCVMSARPGRLLAERVVPFERPRDRHLRESPQFGAMRAELWDLLRGEVEPQRAAHAVGGVRP
ncbi:ABC transporter ATP-binding protein [Nocardioides sp. TF02-7]|uniref:ABC transporter ATP-binding protein n=1 Tax=Nocardioides sp. TF02-7 TaxID=2917724 RepID=UPI001F0609C1|nr:ABC transporter ATP-binding protein [Nocardioides sp. TF02-7]UMG93719.1 ABC transporter ATP-binding protein [Nocardioides sp. TF02-7]